MRELSQKNTIIWIWNKKNVKIKSMKISNIIVHNSGGVSNDNFMSTANITPQSISTYHKSKWNFPSKFIKDEGLRYAGYNVIYDPKTRKFYQCRALGEETAAAIGKNFDSFHICIIGNFNFKKLSKTELVDTMFTYMYEDVVSFLIDLIDGNKRGLVVAPDTIIELSRNRIYPHRMFAATNCFGTGLEDNFFLEKVLSYTKVAPPTPDPVQPTTDIVKVSEIVKEIRLLIALLTKFLAYVRIGNRKIITSGPEDREDPENFNQ